MLRFIIAILGLAFVVGILGMFHALDFQPGSFEAKLWIWLGIASGYVGFGLLTLYYRLEQRACARRGVYCW